MSRQARQVKMYIDYWGYYDGEGAYSIDGHMVLGGLFENGPYFSLRGVSTGHHFIMNLEVLRAWMEPGGDFVVETER